MTLTKALFGIVLLIISCARAAEKSCRKVPINDDKMYGECCVYIKDEPVNPEEHLHRLFQLEASMVASDPPGRPLEAQHHKGPEQGPSNLPIRKPEVNNHNHCPPTEVSPDLNRGHPVGNHDHVHGGPEMHHGRPSYFSGMKIDNEHQLGSSNGADATTKPPNDEATREPIKKLPPWPGVGNKRLNSGNGASTPDPKPPATIPAKENGLKGNATRGDLSDTVFPSEKPPSESTEKNGNITGKIVLDNRNTIDVPITNPCPNGQCQEF